MNDPELGKILVHSNVQARSFIFRVREGRLHLTAPSCATKGEILRAIEKLRPQLKIKLQDVKAKTERQIITPDFRIDAEGFTFWCEVAHYSSMRVAQHADRLVCYYPEGMDFSDEGVQEWLQLMIVESLRRCAKVFFPPRLHAMAEARGLVVREVKINSAQGRWGSCSQRGNINLSLYLMLLPRHLQDLVMHHELTHLVELNHGPRFHALLDKAVGGKEAELERELKRYDTNIFTLQNR
ncbi:MAG: M48 family metallopeptidase [Bacteroidaceae bacterium]|nr:M48 family metallopeptidase [Bacteroidaceae bacterium]